jgi:hypothetical protein
MAAARNPRTTVTAALVAVVAVVVVGVAAFLLLRGGAAEPDAPPVDPEEGPAEGPEDPEEAEPEPADRAPLTGLPVEEPLEQPALLVKVSNSPEARPHTGLEEADVVYEELTEGGVTRFIAVFHSRVPPVVGPVRSARPVDVQVMSGFQVPGFAYSGARDEVRALLADVPAVAVTEGAAGFFRDDGTYASHAYAPHNLFVRAPEVLEVVTAGGAQPLGDLGWAFADEPPGGGVDDGAELRIPMSDAFTTTWTHDPDGGVYRRAQNLVPSFVTGEGEIGAANVVVLAIRHYVGPSGYPETDVLGEGEALVLRDGRRYPARWSKPTATDPLLLLTEDGEVFPLKPGPTWLHLPDELPPTADGGSGDGA